MDYAPMDYASLLEHFKCPSINARFTRNDITFLRTVFCGKLDCEQLVSMFSLSAPTRRSRHTGLFHVPPGRVSATQRCLLKRLPENINMFVNACPDVDFFATSVHWKSQQVLRFCEEQGTYIG